MVRRVVLVAGGVFLAGFAASELWRWNAAGPAELSHEDLPVRELSGTVLNADDALGFLGAIAAVDSFLVVLDAHLDPAVHLISTEGRYLGGLGRDGEAPGEFRAPRSILPATDRSDVFWVYDIALRRLTRIEPDHRGTDETGREVRTIVLHSDAVITDPAWRAPEGILALGFFSEGRFRRFDGEGRMLGTVGSLPDADREVPGHVLQHAWQGRMERRPDGSLLAVGFRHAGRLEIFSPEGELVRRAAVPFEFLPRFWVEEYPDGPGLGTGDDLRFGYVNLAASQDRIYGLFSGRLRGPSEGRGPFGRHIHVFDWEGRLLRVWRLDTDAVAIAVSADEDVLYAARHEPTPAVLRYELP